MSDEKDGGPAFPSTTTQHSAIAGSDVTTQYPGMTLRDYFAAAALTGAIVWDAVQNQHRSTFSSEAETAKAAYAFADAMLKERNKPHD